MVRVGILLTHPDWERQKSELFKYKKGEFPWNKYVPEEEIYKRDWNVRKVGSPYGIADDRAIGCCILHAFKNDDVEVDFITWEEITMARLNSNDLNFILIYDILEAFHMDPTRSKSHYKQVKHCLTKAKNIYPPYHYQQFINSKITYYEYFKKHNVSIIPTLTMTTAKYKKLGHEKAVAQVLERVQLEGWKKFIAKPEYGQDGRDFMCFEPDDMKSVHKHIRFLMKKYPGAIFQKFIKDFGKTKQNAELRMFYCGEKYHYSILGCDRSDYCPEAPRDKEKLKMVPVNLLKRASRVVLQKMPQIVMPNGVRLPRLVTRVDMGFNMDGKVQPFVNEVEFCPSYYVEEAPLERSSKYIMSIGRQMVNITKLYASRRSSLRKTIPGKHLKRKSAR
jgi:hypothetical protein